MGALLPHREEIGHRYDDWSERIVAEFPERETARDAFGFEVNRTAVRGYFAGGRARSIEVVYRALRAVADADRSAVPPARPLLAEVGAHYGINLLLGRSFGLDVVGYELPANVEVYCRALKAQGVPLFGFDIYDDTAPPCERPADVLICSEVVEHLFMDVSTVLERLRPLLRLGGRLLLTTPNIYRRRNLLRLMRGLNVCEKHPSEARRVGGVPVDGRTHPREYTMFEIARAFETAPGWRMLDLCCTPPPPPLRGLKQRLQWLLLRAALRFPVGEYVFALAERTL